jgi:RecA/RadA recombinase
MAAVEAPTLPRRDREARAHLYAAATRAAPSVLARDRVLTVAGPIGPLLPAGVRRGATVALDGPLGAGSTTVACALAAAATSAGEWAAVVDPEGTFGARAAADAGVALERCAIVRNVSADRWPTVVAALLDGATVVIANTGAFRPRAGDARRLVARARERAGVLVVVGAWPVEASIRLHAHGGMWRGLGNGTGLLAGRELDVQVDAKERHDAHRVRLVS